MSRLIVAVLCGLLFGAGMVVSDMINPARVLAFLDVTGAWDPSLAFVMGGALIVMALAWPIQRRMSAPLFTGSFALPDKSDLTPRLVAGSALFGVGWGIAGLCPGPGFAALAIEPAKAAAFVAAMLAGMVLARLVAGRR